MASSTVRFVTVLALLIGESTAATSFLSSKRAQQRVAEDRLRDSVSDLTTALTNHLRFRPLTDATLPESAKADEARNILRQHANAQAWDGADMLNSYADMAPDFALYAPMPLPVAPHVSDFLAGSTQSAAQGGPIGHSVSEATIVRSDGDHTLARTMSCKDGNCKTTESHDAAAKGLLGSDLDAKRSFEASQRPLQNAMRQMSQQMNSWNQNFGRDPLNHALGSIFSMPRMPSIFDSGMSHRDFFHDSMGPSAWDQDFRMPEMPLLKGMDNAKDGFKSAFSQSSNSQSMSSETKMENGKRVTHQKICENGHCKTVVTTEDA